MERSCAVVHEDEEPTVRDRVERPGAGTLLTHYEVTRYFPGWVHRLATHREKMNLFFSFASPTANCQPAGTFACLTIPSLSNRQQR